MDLGGEMAYARSSMTSHHSTHPFSLSVQEPPIFPTRYLAACSGGSQRPAGPGTPTGRGSLLQARGAARWRAPARGGSSGRSPSECRKVPGKS